MSAPAETARRPRGKAFGVDPARAEYYSLRQSRYAVLADDLSRWAGEAAACGARLAILDVGCGAGTLLLHLEGKPHFAAMDISGADWTGHPQSHLFGRDAYRDYFIGDLADGYPDIPSSRYDVVVCEQVLEHLADLDTALATLARLVRPGGRLAIGVPIFPPPLHLARRHIVPRLGWLLRYRDGASHQQAFSLRSLRRILARQPGLAIRAQRGFRIVSGGLLRRLEDHYWWWRFNMRLGALIPFACIEVQLILEKLPAG